MIGVGISPSLVQFAPDTTDAWPYRWPPALHHEIVKLLVFNRARRRIGLGPALDWQFPR